MEKDQEYKELFLAEAMENQAELNRLLTALEKNPGDKKTVNAIFRITHTLKGNALGMGFTAIAELSHTLEDLFGVVREEKLVLDSGTIASVFKAFDTLADLFSALQTGKSVSYKGIKTKLDVLIKRSAQREAEPARTTIEEQPVVELSNNENPASDITKIVEEIESHIAFSDLVQVPVRKLDNLLNLVGELIIEKDRFMAAQNTARNEYSRLNRIASDLQYSVMDVRLVQVAFLFNKFHRVVRDAAATENKNVNLKLEGTDTEIDRNVLQVISDSLIHLIRNSIGHGIESPEERAAAGKPKEGTVTLRAASEADAVIIEISDDGKGIDLERVRGKAVQNKMISESEARALTDQEVIMMIFEPGFSTMDHVTAISGRGVGMDVVKKALDSIGGNIHVVTSRGEGTTFRLTLPSSMAVKSTLLFEAGNTNYAIPLSYTQAVVSIYAEEVHRVGNGLVATHLGRTLSIVFLKDLLADNFQTRMSTNEKVLQESLLHVHPEQKLEIIIVSHNGRTVGFVVDKLHQQKEIVEKPLSKPVDKVNFISGVTILGNGGVCLVLNVANVLNFISGMASRGRTLKNTIE